MYYQSLNSEENAAVPGYSKYTAATGEWSTTALIGANGIWARLDQDDGLAHSQQPVAISRSPNGQLHVAWSYQNVLVLTKQGESGWSEQQQVVPFPYESKDVAYNLLDLAFMTVGKRLKLFLPGSTPLGGANRATAMHARRRRGIVPEQAV